MRVEKSRGALTRVATVSGGRSHLNKLPGCLILPLLVAFATAACTPATPTPTAKDGTSLQVSPPVAQPSRTLVISTRTERESLAGTLLHPQSGDSGTLRRVW